MRREHLCEDLKITFFKNTSRGRRPFQCVRTCSWLFVRACSCSSLNLHMSAGKHREHVCEHLKNMFSKNTSWARCPFHALEPVPGYLFENVCVIPVIRVHLQERIANMCANILKTSISKIPPEGDALFMFWNVFPVVCSRMFVWFPISAYIVSNIAI